MSGTFQSTRNPLRPIFLVRIQVTSALSGLLKPSCSSDRLPLVSAQATDLSFPTGSKRRYASYSYIQLAYYSLFSSLFHVGYRILSFRTGSRFASSYSSIYIFSRILLRSQVVFSSSGVGFQVIFYRPPFIILRILYLAYGILRPPTDVFYLYITFATSLLSVSAISRVSTSFSRILVGTALYAPSVFQRNQFQITLSFLLIPLRAVTVPLGPYQTPTLQSRAGFTTVSWISLNLARPAPYVNEITRPITRSYDATLSLTLATCSPYLSFKLIYTPRILTDSFVTSYIPLKFSAALRLNFFRALIRCITLYFSGANFAPLL